jgi:protein TonB
VETDGSLTNVSYFKKLDTECDNEAMRVLKLMPKWIPAKTLGKIHRNNYSVNFVFRCSK